MIKQTSTKVININRAMVFWVGLAVVLAVAALLMAASGPAQAAFPGTNGRIAFYTGGDVWTMDGDGTNPTKLTNNYNAEANPAVSPDGSRIAYEFLPGIWVMNATGGAKTNLTNDNGTSDKRPSFSPDGTRILFESDRGSSCTRWAPRTAQGCSG